MPRLKKIRQLLALSIVIAGVALVVSVISNSKHHKSEAPPPKTLSQNVDMALQKVHYTEIKDGLKRWDLYADEAVYDKTKQFVHLERPRLVLAASEPAGEIVLTANVADYDTSTKDIRLEGKVLGNSQSGIRISSEKVTYLAASSVITTKDSATYTDGNITVTGVGLRFNTKTRNLIVKDDVTAEIRNETSK